MAAKTYLKSTLTISLFSLLILLSTSAHAKTIYVDDDGPADFDSIQVAIEDSNDGDVIIVADGKYFENINFMGHNITLTSTDPNNPQVVAETVIDGGGYGSVVTFESGEDSNCVLTGFTITNGDVLGHRPHYYGGGIYCRDSIPTIINCIISRNLARYGGGMFIDSNTGMMVTNCTFIENTASDEGAGFCNHNTDLILKNCKFTGNLCGHRGGGLLNSDALLSAVNCTFTGNYSDHGGGAMVNQGLSNAKMTNCTFTCNSTHDDGGGIYSDSSTTLTNCILWANSDADGMDESSQIHGNPPLVNYCCIQGLSGNFGGIGNIGCDPMFVRNPKEQGRGNVGTIDDDYGYLHLRCGSPCLDAGINDTDPPLPLTDLDGQARVVDSIVDMGAYEGRTQAFVIAPARILVPEDSTAEFTVTLVCEPAGSIDATVTHYKGGADITIVSGEVLTFDRTNFSDPHIVVLAADQDSDRLEDFAQFRISADSISFAEALAWEVENDVPSVLFVDTNASGTDDGTSWENAFRHLQDAITVAADARWAVDEIRVAGGSYKPDKGAGITPGDRRATFQLINDVALKGGYAGFGETNPDTQDIELYETILSGDLNGNDVDVNDLSDLLDDPSRAENSYHVVTGSGTDVTAVLDGFTITDGYANSNWPYHQQYGGGMYNFKGNPTVRNCTFRENRAHTGGGMGNDKSSPIIINCSFIRNSSAWAGGMSNLSSSPTLTKCTFSGNFRKAMENNRSCTELDNCAFIENNGRGMANNDSNLTLNNCTFIGNISGGMSNFRGKLRLSNCIFKGNSGGKGGGYYSLGSCSTLYNCIFAGNSARYYGGGLYVQAIHEYNWMDMSGEWDLTLINCTFTGNSAVNGNAMASDSLWQEAPGNIQIANCIFWNGGDEISNRDNSTFEVTYCDVWGGFPGEGNIDADPCFVEPDCWDANELWVDGDYHLLPGSPCIDTGAPNYVAEPNETDLDGKPRVIGCRVDMGAYEYGQLIPAEARFAPRTINLASKGNWLSSSISLPEDYNVADIDTDTILLECEIEPESVLVDEAKQVTTARFSRGEVQPILEVGDINLKITGRLTDGTWFEGIDTIKVIDKAGKN
jgi:hypothetical protein